MCIYDAIPVLHFHLKARLRVINTRSAKLLAETSPADGGIGNENKCVWNLKNGNETQLNWLLSKAAPNPTVVKTVQTK